MAPESLRRSQPTLRAPTAKVPLASVATARPFTSNTRTDARPAPGSENDTVTAPLAGDGNMRSLNPFTRGTAGGTPDHETPPVFKSTNAVFEPWFTVAR